jgi:predicted RNase H-like HicB family nuclease
MNVLRDRGPGADAKGRSTLNAFIYGLNAWSRDRAEIPLSLALLRSEDSHRSAEVARKSSALLSMPALLDVIGTDVGALLEATFENELWVLGYILIAATQNQFVESGWLTASCPALPVCITQAETEEQLEINIRESVMLWLEVQDGKELKSVQSAEGCGSAVHELILSF